MEQTFGMIAVVPWLDVSYLPNFSYIRPVLVLSRSDSLRWRTQKPRFCSWNCLRREWRREATNIMKDIAFHGAKEDKP